MVGHETAVMLEQREIQTSGHFVLKAGDHSNSYVRKDQILANTYPLEIVVNEMGQLISENVDAGNVEAVVGIAPCSAIIASQLGRVLKNIWGKDLVTVFAEKVPELDDSGDKPKITEPLRFKRDYDTEIEGLNGIVVEDIVTTGSTLFELKELLATIKGYNTVATTAVVNRNPNQVTEKLLGMGRWLPLISVDVEKWQEQDCNLCQDLYANPINTNLGKGAKFVSEHGLKEGQYT